MTAQKRCSQPETDYSKTIWCMKPPFLHQWHHLVSKLILMKLSLISKKPWKIEKTLSIINYMYTDAIQLKQVISTPKTYQPHKDRKKCIHGNLFMLIIGNSKIQRMGKWIDSNKSLIVKYNKNDQRLCGEDTHNQWHEEKHANLTGKLINVCKNCWNWNKWWWCQWMTDW